MKKLVGLICLITVVSVFASSSPYPPWAQELINRTVMNLDSGKVIVGNGNGKGVPVAISGAATMSNTGVLTVGDEIITEAMLVDDATDGLGVARLARATYDVAVDLGTVAAHGLGVSLPPNALITRSWLHTVTQFTDGGSGTVAISCEDANNIFTATDITAIAAGVNTAGEQTGSIAAFTNAIAATCEITATVATAEQTAGKLIVFIEYVVAE